MVKDAKTNNPVIGAAVFELGDATVGTATDTEGFFTLHFEKKHILLKIAYIGYKDTVFDIQLKKDTALIVNLLSETNIDEVKIEDDSLNWKPKTDELSGNYKYIPAENYKKEELKAKKFILPKPKQNAKPAVSELYFADNNSLFGRLIFIDNAPIYSSEQLVKLMPFINAISVGDYRYNEADFPAEYGNRLAPVLSIKMKEGSTETYSGTVHFNLFGIGISAEGPVKENRSSFFVSARKSYLNNFYTDLFRKDNSGEELYWSQPSFWDMNLKYTHQLTERSQFSASFFHNYNRLTYGVNEEPEDSITHGTHRNITSSYANTTVSMIFNHRFSENIYFNSTVFFSNYKSKNAFVGDSIGISSGASTYINRYNAAYASGNNDLGLKLISGYNLNNEHQLLFGANITNRHFKTVDAKLVLNDFEHTNNIDTTWNSDAVNAQKYAVFAQDNFSVNDALNINGGLRFSAFVNSGTSYFSVEPRLSANYKLFKFLSLNFAYDYHKEYVHLLTGNSLGLTSDIFIPSSENILPQITNHFAAGAKINLPFDIKLKGSVFYDNIKNLYDYKKLFTFFDFPNKKIMTGMHIEDRIVPAKGNYTGIRTVLSKKYKGLSINIGHTISDFTVKSDSINFAQAYPYRNNRRNEFNLKLSYAINENLNVFANWTYRSGNFVTLRKQHYIPYEYNNGQLGTGNLPDASTMYLTDYTQNPPFNRNDFKLPAYHRLDIGIDYKYENHSFGIHIYNVYNRKNPDLIDYKRSVLTNQTSNQAVNFTNLPFFPTVNYSYHFEY